MARCSERVFKAEKEELELLEDPKLRIHPFVVLCRLSDGEISRFCPLERRVRSCRNETELKEEASCGQELNKKGGLSSSFSFQSLDSKMCDSNYASSSDDELPKVNFYSAGKQKRNYTEHEKTSSEPSNYIATLLELIERQDKVQKSKAETLKLEEELQSQVTKNASATPDLSINENEMELDFLNDDLMPKEEYDFSSDAESCHPGKPVLDFSCAGKLFTQEKLTFKDMNDCKTAVDEMLQKASPDILDDLLQRESFILYFEYITDKSAAIRLLFRMLSIHSDYFVSLRCKDILIEILKRDSSLVNCITLKDIIEVFLNYGTTLDRLIPVPELLKSAENVMNSDEVKSHSSSEQTLCWSSLPIHCLKNVVTVIRALIRYNNSKITDIPENLIMLVIMLCNLALDTSFRTVPEVAAVQQTIDEILQRFTEESWSDQVPFCLAQHLVSLNDHPENLLFVARMFFHSERGHQLQRLSSYLMVNKLLSVDVKLDNSNDVLPVTVLNFMQSVSWTQYADLPLLFNILMMIDLCVGCNFINGNWNIFEELSRVVKRMGNVIKFNCKTVGSVQKYNFNIVKIEDMAARLHLMWHIQAKSAPVSQKTMFSYFDPLPKDFEIDQNANGI